MGCMPISDRGFTPWQPPQDASQASRESCTMQAMISGVVGGGAGLVLGAVLAPFQSNVASLEEQNLPMREQFRQGVKHMGQQSRSWGKSLMVIGAVFSCSECFVEKTRGRTDRWNPIYGGCITGGILAAQGAQRMRILLITRAFIDSPNLPTPHAPLSLLCRLSQLGRRQWHLAALASQLSLRR